MFQLSKRLQLAIIIAIAFFHFAILRSALSEPLFGEIANEHTPSLSASQQMASPEDFGFPVPKPEPALPKDADEFAPPLYSTNTTDAIIAEFSRTADRDQVVSMTGVELNRLSGFDVFSQAPEAQKGTLVSMTPLRADRIAATALLPETLPPWSMYLVWPKRGETRGKPFAINRTEGWWIGPDSAAAGAIISVYGRNLAHSNGKSKSFIYIKSADKAGQYVAPIAVNPFKVDFKIPDIASGTYEVWVHNGHGGRFGWSGPLKFNVLEQSHWANQDRTTFNVKDFGAVGNGTADDTSSIETALETASKSAPSTVYFPSGKYLVSTTLKAPSNVRWLGDGMNATEIRLGTHIDGNMVTDAEKNAKFENITLNANRNTGSQPLLWAHSVANLSLQSVRLEAWGTAALEAQDARGLYINSSELIENGSFYGKSRQIFMTNNKFRMTGYGESAVALWGGRELSMVGNDLANADESRVDGFGIGRFFVAQAHFGSMQDLYWGENTSHNAAPHDCNKVDCNKGEQICFEMVGSELKTDFVAATADTVTFGSLVPSPETNDADLVIVAGRGAGQRRHITSVNNNTASLDAPWNIVPDSSSQFALAATASRIAIYNNQFQGRDSFDEHDSDSTAVLLYGNVYDAVVDHNRISQMRHGMMTVALSSAQGLSPYFLQYSNNVVTDSNSGLYVGTTFTDNGNAGVWGGLGNIYRGNKFRNLSHIGVQFEMWDNNGADFNGTVFEKNEFTNLPYGFIDGYKLMWTYNNDFKAPPSNSSRKYNTILYKNIFERGSAPLSGSVGFKTLQPQNTWMNIGSVWTGFAIGNSEPTRRHLLPE